MSSQKGNVKKQGPPKHQNVTVFKNTMHDTSQKTKMITSLEVTGVCLRCTEIIEWKIKYKKYKPLTQPKKCVKCQQKSVKRAYYIVCQKCANNLGVCAKCGQKADIIQKSALTPAEEARQRSLSEFELSQLSERQRRTFYRQKESLSKQGHCSSQGEEEAQLEEDEDSVDMTEETAEITTDTACSNTVEAGDIPDDKSVSGNRKNTENSAG